MVSRFETETKRLGDNILSWIGDFLFKEGFPSCYVTRQGLLLLLDSIRDYAEEGRRLFPEIIVTTSLPVLLKTLPSHRLIQVEACNLREDIFIKILKRCAPLALDGWIIYVEISAGMVKYGLVSAENSELSASIYQHLVGELSVSEYPGQLAYIRPIGAEFLEIRGSKTELIIGLRFIGQYNSTTNEIKSLIGHIISLLENRYSPILSAFFHRLFEETFTESHGCIIAVIHNTSVNITILREKCDGVFFDTPIDLVNSVLQSEESKTRESSTIMRSYSTIVKRMINHDGIAVFSTDGSLLAYNLFFHDIGAGHNVTGGARKRTFRALIESDIFKCCFFRSQDGNIEIWERQND
jgi:hypothetical protein